MSGIVTAADHAAHCAALLQHAERRSRAREPESVALSDADVLGRITASATHSAMPLPPFDNSQMDGYAVNAADLAAATPDSAAVLRIGVATAAGDAQVEHEPGTASPVMTGAPIPEGADAVVPIEEALPPTFPLLARAGEGEPSGAVAFAAPTAEGRFVRRVGSDLAQGARILPPDSRLTPARIGALAAAGHGEVAVLPRVRVLLCSTGDELSVADTPLIPGRIYDANTPMLAAAMRSAGAQVRTLTVPDDVDAFREAVTEHDADVIVTSGGVSEGAYEVVRETLEPLGIAFTKVAMQPGGPQGSGLLEIGPHSESGAVPVLCFPGNPVSVVLSAELFLIPTLRRLAGLPAERERYTRHLAQEVNSPAAKLQLRRGCIDEDGRVSLSGPSSHLLSALASADVIAEIPLGVDHLAENSPVTTWSIND